ncbi:MAG: tetratricopeptide repeat protein, partial [Ignavibacteriaceae bacterium]
MDILIIAGIALIIVLVVLILIKRGNKKINYKDRIELETILDNEELPKKDVDNTTKKPTKESSDVILPKTNIQDDSIIKLTDESAKYYNKGVALVKAKKYEESIPYLNTAIRLNSSEGIAYYYRG